MRGLRSRRIYGTEKSLMQLLFSGLSYLGEAGQG
jgi:hypothetical protein